MTEPEATEVELCCMQSACRWAAANSAVTCAQPPLTEDSEGTVTGGGPDERTTRMAEPSLTEVPAFGDCWSTLPAGTVIDERRPTTRSEKWSGRSTALAVAWVSPVRAGSLWLAANRFAAVMP